MARMLSRYARWRATPDESARKPESQVTGGARRNRLAPSRRAPSDDEHARGESLDADSATPISLPAPRSRGDAPRCTKLPRGARWTTSWHFSARGRIRARATTPAVTRRITRRRRRAPRIVGPARAAAAAATVRALLDAIDAVPAAPAGAFAKAREPSTPPGTRAISPVVDRWICVATATWRRRFGGGGKI